MHLGVTMTYRGSHFVLQLFFLLPCLVLSQTDNTKMIHRPGSTALRTRLASIGIMPHMTRYLKRFGYLPEDFSGGFNTLSSTAEGSLHSSAAGPMREAIMLFQKKHGLQVTGHMDKQTMDLSKKARCGNKDVNFKFHANSSDIHSVSHYAYFDDLRTPGTSPPLNMSDAPKWDRTYFTWALSSSVSTPDWTLKPEDIRPILQRVFDRWAKVTNFKFTEAPNPPDMVPHSFSPNGPYATIEISLHRGYHNDTRRNAFDGPGGTLAHGFAPMDGYLHFDSEERWSISLSGKAPPGTYDFESVATHEMGHILGLDHSSNPLAVMYSTIGSNEVKRELHADDIEGIKKLYNIQ